jgi:hypothetical protein
MRRRRLEGGNALGPEKTAIEAGGTGALAAAGAILLVLPSAATPANRASPTSVTLRCTLHGSGSDDTIIQYFLIDSDQKAVSSGGELHRVGADPSGQTLQVLAWPRTTILGQFRRSL